GDRYYEGARRAQRRHRTSLPGGSGRDRRPGRPRRAGGRRAGRKAAEHDRPPDVRSAGERQPVPCLDLALGGIGAVRGRRQHPGRLASRPPGRADGTRCRREVRMRIAALALLLLGTQEPARTGVAVERTVRRTTIDWLGKREEIQRRELVLIKGSNLVIID